MILADSNNYQYDESAFIVMLSLCDFVLLLNVCAVPVLYSHTENLC